MVENYKQRMNINNVAKSDSITYDCGLLTKEALDKVANILQQTQIIDKLKEMGVQVPKIILQPNMHCTLRYLSDIQDVNKRVNQLSNQELHCKGTLCVESVGVYVKDGVLMNLGLYVNEEKSMNEEEFSNIRDGLFNKDISHVTVAINRDKGNDGRRLAKAVDTEKCFTQFDGTPTSGEFSYVIKLDEPVILPVTAEAVCGTQVVDFLTDYPKYREEKELADAFEAREEDNIRDGLNNEIDDDFER